MQGLPTKFVNLGRVRIIEKSAYCLTQIRAKINSPFFYSLPGPPLTGAVTSEPDKETLRFLEQLTSDKHEMGR